MQPTPATVRIQLSNILFTTDFSEVSKTALPYATQLARWYEGTIFLTHVVPTYETYMSVPLEPVPVDLDRLWRRDEQCLTDLAADHVLDDIRHEAILRRGELWSAISDVIAKKNIDLVVTGTHGRRGFAKAVLGSVAEKIYRHCACPVLTVGPEIAATRSTDWQLKQILFATDFSETSLNALPYALSLAEENQATLIFLHVITSTPADQSRDSFRETAQARLESLMPPEPWCRPEFVAVFNLPGQGILRVARERSVDLIVMGVKKPAGLTFTLHLPWATAAEVVSGAPCPVLTVRG